MTKSARVWTISSAIAISLAVLSSGVLWRYQAGIESLEVAQQFLNSQSWDDSLHSIASARSALPFVFDTRATVLTVQTRSEQEAQANLETVKEALRAEEWDAFQAALAAIPPDSVYAADAEWVRAQAQTIQKDEQEAQRVLNEGRLAFQLGEWDDALRILSTVPQSRSKAVSAAQELSDRVLLAKETEAVGVAWVKVAAAIKLVKDAHIQYVVSKSTTDRSRTANVLGERALSLSSAARSLQFALNPTNRSNLPPAHLLSEEGSPLASDVSELAFAVRVAAFNGELRDRDVTDLDTSVSKLSRWARPLLFSGSLAVSDPTVSGAQGLANEGSSALKSIAAFAANPDPRAQYLIAWVASSVAASPSEGEGIFHYILNDRLANVGRQALANRLRDPMSAIVFGDRNVAVSDAPNSSSGNVGELLPGTVVNILGRIPAVNSSGDAFDYYTRLRIPDTGRIVYYKADRGDLPRLVANSDNALLQASGAVTANAVKAYLSRGQKILFSVLTGSITGDGKTQLLLNGSGDGCGSCHFRW